jgi:hypothetical protein
MNYKISLICLIIFSFAIIPIDSKANRPNEPVKTSFPESLSNSGSWRIKKIERIKKPLSSSLSSVSSLPLPSASLPVSSLSSPLSSQDTLNFDYPPWLDYDHDYNKRDVVPFYSSLNHDVRNDFISNLDNHDLVGVVIQYLPISSLQKERTLFGLDRLIEPYWPNFLVPLIVGIFLIPLLFLLWINLFQFVSMFRYNYLNDSLSEFKFNKIEELSRSGDKNKMATIFKTWLSSLEKYENEKKKKN